MSLDSKFLSSHSARIITQCQLELGEELPAFLSISNCNGKVGTNIGQSNAEKLAGVKLFLREKVERGFEHAWSDERLSSYLKSHHGGVNEVDDGDYINAIKFAIDTYKLPESTSNYHLWWAITTPAGLYHLRKELDADKAISDFRESHNPHDLGSVKEIAKRSGLGVKEVRRLKASGDLVNKLHEMGLLK